MRTPERTWTPRITILRRETVRERKRGREGRKRRKGDDSRVLCKNAQTFVFGDNSCLERGHPLVSSVADDRRVFAPSLIFLSTLSRRSGLKGPVVKGRVVLKGMLKRMPPDANCAVRERLALFATEWLRDDSSRATARFVETIVTRRCSILIDYVA